MQLAVPGAILTLCLSTQAYIATQPEMGQQMRPSELSHPVPLSFEPVKNFFKEFAEAIRNTFQTPMDTRLKESELPNPVFRLTGAGVSWRQEGEAAGLTASAARKQREMVLGLNRLTVAFLSSLGPQPLAWYFLHLG